MSRSNCLFFAHRLYRRRAKTGKQGYIVHRTSHYGWFPHFMYLRLRKTGKIQLVGYVPTNPKHKKFPPPLFKGKIQWGDPPKIIGKNNMFYLQLKALFTVLKQGKELKNAAAWKNVQGATAAVAAILAAIFSLSPVEITSEYTAATAGGIVAFYNIIQLYLTYATSAKVGVPSKSEDTKS